MPESIKSPSVPKIAESEVASKPEPRAHSDKCAAVRSGAAKKEDLEIKSAARARTSAKLASA